MLGWVGDLFGCGEGRSGRERAVVEGGDDAEGEIKGWDDVRIHALEGGEEVQLGCVLGLDSGLELGPNGFDGCYCVFAVGLHGCVFLSFAGIYEQRS